MNQDEEWKKLMNQLGKIFAFIIILYAACCVLIILIFTPENIEILRTKVNPDLFNLIPLIPISFFILIAFFGLKGFEKEKNPSNR